VQNPVVLVDTREHAEEVKESGCGVVKTKLEVGDYVAGRFVFKRKSVQDFINSIIDGRLFDQATRLRETKLRPVIVVEGDLWEELQFRKISPNATQPAENGVTAPRSAESSPHFTCRIYILVFEV